MAEFDREGATLLRKGHRFEDFEVGRVLEHRPSAPGSMSAALSVMYSYGSRPDTAALSISSWHSVSRYQRSDPPALNITPITCHLPGTEWQKV